MENTKYLKIEDRFKRILETNYSDEEKILILHKTLTTFCLNYKQTYNIPIVMKMQCFVRKNARIIIKISNFAYLKWYIYK